MFLFERDAFNQSINPSFYVAILSNSHFEVHGSGVLIMLYEIIAETGTSLAVGEELRHTLEVILPR